MMVTWIPEMVWPITVFYLPRIYVIYKQNSKATPVFSSWSS